MRRGFATRAKQLLPDIDISESSNWRYGETNFHFLKTGCKDVRF